MRTAWYICAAYCFVVYIGIIITGSDVEPSSEIFTVLGLLSLILAKLSEKRE